MRQKLKKAVEYALKRQAMLTTWIEEAYIPMDNNGVERAAIPYTLLQECERCKVDSLAWLTRVLEILPAYRGNYVDLMPGKLELPTTTSKQL